VFRAIVAAGGRGNRLHLGRPKSSLLFLNRSLLWWTVLSLRKAGFCEIDVFVNDSRWVDEFRNEIYDIEGINILEDEGYPNTFLLFRDNTCKPHTYLFAYGHAPRPPADYARLAYYQTALVASAVRGTSKRQRIVSLDGQLLEPPFLVRTSSIETFAAQDWLRFFETNYASLSISPNLEIAEFNSSDEWASYQDYLEKRLKHTGLLTCEC